MSWTPQKLLPCATESYGKILGSIEVTNTVRNESSEVCTMTESQIISRTARPTQSISIL